MECGGGGNSGGNGNGSGGGDSGSGSSRTVEEGDVFGWTMFVSFFVFCFIIFVIGWQTKQKLNHHRHYSPRPPPL